MTRRKRCQLLGVWSLLGCMLLGGCAPRNTDAGAEILIGEYASMTGTTATYGQSGHKGTMLAVEEINAKGGILGKKNQGIDRRYPIQARRSGLCGEQTDQ